MNARFFLPTSSDRDTVKDMEIHFSPQTEQFLAHAVSSGMFPSKEAAIDAAVEALREKTEPIPMVPDEHMASVEEALESYNAGEFSPMTETDWAELRQRVHDIAARAAGSGG